MTIEQALEILTATDRGEWVDGCEIEEAYRVISEALAD